MTCGLPASPPYFHIKLTVTLECGSFALLAGISDNAANSSASLTVFHFGQAVSIVSNQQKGCMA
jgi:hypothetical protein